MKLNSLQLGKAISAALFVLLLVVAGMKNVLAQTQVATLQHGDSISGMYYGSNALVSAHTAAVDGDIITLSSGSFTSTTITKAITLHGSGCVSDTLGITPTIISGDFAIGISNTSNFLIIEGISFQGIITYWGSLNHAKFIKCNFNSIKNYGINGPNFGSLNDVQFLNCLINNALIFAASNNVSILNSVIGSLGSNGNTSAMTNIYNSIVKVAQNSKKLFLYNSVIGSTTTGESLSESSAYNCIVVGSVFSSSVQTFNCMTVDSYSDVFEDWDGTFSFDADYYFLKEDIATTFLGNDGREISIYGGAMPYNPRPSYLILNRCNVAPRSTVDGKLSVDIEVISNGNY